MGMTSTTRVLPFATLPANAAFQNGGVRPLAMLASNGQMIDGRAVPMIDPWSGGPRTMALPSGISPSPKDNLKYRGGRTIRDLKWINIYVGGQAVWDTDDWRSIDRALVAAMTDEPLNAILRQYFNNQPLGNTFRGSYFLSAWRPQTVSRLELEQQVTGLYTGGAFQGMDLPNTVMNFMLPRGVILGDPTGGAPASAAIPNPGTEDSTGGLAGYHGSVHIDNAIVYYTVGVYSERQPGGQTNGIPVFNQNWKNVVATFYHQLQEARTNPDVNDARAGLGPDPAKLLGWTSDAGHEIGDAPLAMAPQLASVFVEVPLASGAGAVPIQLMYSNAVSGPEAPASAAPQPQPQPGPTPPTTTDPELARLIESWGQLEDFVKKAIIRLANSQ